MATVPPGDIPRKKTNMLPVLVCPSYYCAPQRLAGRSKALEKWEALSQGGYITLTMKVASCCVRIKNYKEPALYVQLT